MDVPDLQVICNDRGRGQSSFPSWGRRKRALRASFPSKSRASRGNSTIRGEEEEVHELLQVYLSQEDVPEPNRLEGARETATATPGKVCVDKFAYYSLVMLSALFVLLFVVIMPYFAVVKAAKFKYQVSAAGWFEGVPCLTN